MDLNEIFVKVLDVDKINEDLNKIAIQFFESNDPGKDLSNIKFGLRGPRAILVFKNGNAVVIDNELVGDVINDGNPQIELDIYSTRYEDGKIKGFGMFPELTIKASVEDFMKYELKEVAVVEFMGSRYNYNSRLKSNQSDFLNLYNENN